MLKRVYVDKSDVVLQGEARMIHPLRALFLLLDSLTEAIGDEPRCYMMEKSNILRILFRHSYFETEMLIEEYGSILGKICRKIPISVHGSTGEFEDVEISVTAEGENTVFKKYNATGKNFRALRHLYFQLNFEDGEQCAFAHEILLRGFCNKCVAMDRIWQTNPLARELFAEMEFFYYKYAKLRPCEGYEDCLRSLSVEQIAKLWAAFLEDGISYEEFERFAELMEEGQEVDSYSWAFALELALEAKGFDVQMDKNGFVIADSKGKRKVYDYRGGQAAERLLLKFLFPA